jgi:putative SOS response-associated peptidase YedK
MRGIARELAGGPAGIEGEGKSFTIMTGPSAGLLGDYHDLAPVVIDPADWGVWLDPAQDATPQLAAVRAERFVVGAVV